MVSHKFKFIYARVPKTASSSLLHLMESHVKDMKPVGVNDWELDKNHIPMYHLKKYFHRDL